MITLYTKNNCMPCNFTKLQLTEMDIPYTERNVDTDEQYLQEVKSLGYNGVPIVLKDGIVIANGFQPDVLNGLEGMA